MNSHRVATSVIVFTKFRAQSVEMDLEKRKEREASTSEKQIGAVMKGEENIRKTEKNGDQRAI